MRWLRVLGLVFFLHPAGAYAYLPSLWIQFNYRDLTSVAAVQYARWASEYLSEVNPNGMGRGSLEEFQARRQEIFEAAKENDGVARPLLQAALVELGVISRDFLHAYHPELDARRFDEARLEIINQISEPESDEGMRRAAQALVFTCIKGRPYP